MKIAISACLLGDKVRYDGKSKKDNKLVNLLKGHELIKICPEIQSGLPIPRKQMEIRNNKVYTIDNIDFLSVFFLDFNTIMLVIYHKHGIL